VSARAMLGHQGTERDGESELKGAEGDGPGRAAR
jgi:hypothetical protein